MTLTNPTKGDEPATDEGSASPAIAADQFAHRRPATASSIGTARRRSPPPILPICFVPSSGSPATRRESVAVVLGASVKLYQPWTWLNSVDFTGIDSLLDECHALWSKLGLEHAILNTSDPESTVTIRLSLDNIKSILDLDAFSLEDHISSQKEVICRLSLLTSEVVNGKQIQTSQFSILENSVLFTAFGQLVLAWNMWELLICSLRESLVNKSKLFEVSGHYEFKTQGYHSFMFKVMLILFPASIAENFALVCKFCSCLLLLALNR
nr:protein PFC0760c isoform X2 [Ipomoea batatas]GMC68397.1 protein PFC0760c isoform X2 [Ipomoea batatas]